jgi:hypothetical protein
MSRFFEIETRPGQPLRSQGRTIIPFARTLRVGIPHAQAGLIWNRPVSVLVQTRDGQEVVLPVEDVTRMAVWAVWGGALLTVLLLWLTRRKVPK